MAGLRKKKMHCLRQMCEHCQEVMQTELLELMGSKDLNCHDGGEKSQG